MNTPFPIIAQMDVSQCNLGTFQLTERWRLDKEKLLKMADTSEAFLEMWERKAYQEKNILLFVPPQIHSVRPTTAFFAFQNAKVGDTVEVDCAINFIRKGFPSTEAEIDRLAAEHMRTDGQLLSGIMQALFKDKVSNFAGLLESAFRQTYRCVAPPTLAIRAKNELFTMEFEPLGNSCAVCGKLGKHLQCACKQRVYYCGKGCQVSHWPTHRAVCPLAGRK